MPIPITIARLGWNMEEGVFLGWLKRDGDTVQPGDMLYRLESEKAAEDIECLDAGVLRIAPNGPKEGDTVLVSAIIGHLLQTGEEGLQIADFGSQIAEAKTTAPAVVSPIADTPREANHDAAKASPRARRVAKELGVDWKSLNGSGAGGRIRERDVRAAMTQQPRGNVVPLSSTRRTIAERLVKSRQATVPVTLTTTIDATNLVSLRVQFKSQPGDVPSLNDFFVKLTALALLKHPLLAARWGEDHLVLADAIHVGVAVDTDAGLLVPVIHDAATLPLKQIAARSRDLVERARLGKLTSKDLQGGVFTVTNLGMLGIDAFTPIINHPECAILGIGRVRRMPVFVDDKVTPREQVTLSLTFDHRIVDGAPAARFLQTLTQAIENPAPWLMA
jgi:pyruvate dehydrogenase E2 component (dihydrolipoamide acetyltransferase)